MGEGVYALACLAPKNRAASKRIFFNFWRWLLLADPRPSKSLLWLVELVEGVQEKEKEK